MTQLMLYIKILIICLFISSQGFAQRLTPYENLKRGFLLDQYPNRFNYDKSHTDSAEFYFNSFLSTVNKSDNNYGLGIFYVANYYFEKEDFSKAEQLLKLYLSIDKPSKYEPFEIGDYLSELDPNYYDRFVFEWLSEISIINRQFELGLQYIKKAERSSFEAVCGNALLTRGPFIDHKKAICYIGLNQQDSALAVLLPHVFNTRYRDYQYILYNAVSLLKSKYYGGTSEVVEASINGLKSEKVRHENLSFRNYYIILDGIKIDIPPPNFFEKSTYREYINSIRNSDFYKFTKK